MSNPELIKQILTEARSHKFFSDKPVTEAELKTLYDLAKMAPSASNGCPMRITFVTSPEGKERVLKASNPGNVEKIASAPVTMIIAYDTKFYDQYPKLAPHMPSPPNEASLPDAALERIALRNSSLQAGFVMVAARSLGLDCGPKSGFKNDIIDDLFYAGTNWRSNFIINLGHGNGETIRPRAARLDFDEACEIV